MSSGLVQPLITPPHNKTPQLKAARLERLLAVPAANWRIDR
jgi:hypothetical protein